MKRASTYTMVMLAALGLSSLVTFTCAESGTSDSGEFSASVTLIAPTSLAAAGAAGPTVRLSWDDNSNFEDGYRVERSPGDSLHWAEVAVHVVAANSAEAVYRDTTVAAATLYFYRVRAFIDSSGYYGFSAYSDPASATTP